MNRGVKGVFIKKTEEEVYKIVNEKYPKFRYISGYESVDDFFILECVHCGYQFTRKADILRPSRTKVIRCKACIEKAKEEKRNEIIKRKAEREKRKKEIDNEREIKKFKICAECGERFISSNRRTCCKDECDKRRKNRRKDKRIYKNGKADISITLTKLIKRDNNKCHICNGECNINDFVVREDNTFIAGNRYPSIDHVIPIARGGVHEWDNVKLAHRYCNSIKNDNIYLVEYADRIKEAM